ncbi:MAG: hypothetical protein DMG56_23195, partial [Acidobacteria bacterium]
AWGVTALLGLAAAQIFKMEKGFELVVESGDAGGGDAGRKRQDQPIALNLGPRKNGFSRSRQVQGPQAIVGVGAGRKGQQASGEAQRVSEEPSEQSPA